MGAPRELTGMVNLNLEGKGIRFRIVSRHADKFGSPGRKPRAGVSLFQHVISQLVGLFRRHLDTGVRAFERSLRLIVFFLFGGVEFIG